MTEDFFHTAHTIRRQLGYTQSTAFVMVKSPEFIHRCSMVLAKAEIDLAIEMFTIFTFGKFLRTKWAIFNSYVKLPEGSLNVDMFIPAPWSADEISPFFVSSNSAEASSFSPVRCGRIFLGKLVKN